MQSLLWAVIFLLTVNKSISVYWQHGNCIAYLNQTKPFVPNTANHCFTDYTTGTEYCLYSDCPKPPCKKPYHDGHICQTCPGKCQEGKRFYDPGAKFLSYDGFRKCQCQRDPGFGAKMFCQVIDTPDPFNFCGIPYPFGYKKGVDVRSGQSFNNGVINNPAAHHNSLNNGGGALQGGVNFIGAPAPTNPVPMDFYPTAPPPVAHNTPGVPWNHNNMGPAVGGANQQWQNNGGQQGPNNNGGGQWQNNGGNGGIGPNNGGGQQWQNNGGNGGQGQNNGGGGQQWQNNGGNGGQNNGGGQQWQNNGNNGGGPQNGGGGQWQNNNGQNNRNGGGGWQNNNNYHTTMWPQFETK